MRFRFSFGWIALSLLMGAVKIEASKVERLAEKSWASFVTSEKAYLQSLLKELGVEPESQVLVFSKTSHQIAKISPNRPRAIYFNEDYYVGYVQQGLLEIIEMDSDVGAKFYTLEAPTTPDQKPAVVEDSSCLSCHESHHDFEVPGLMVRSVFADAQGQPMLNLGTFRTTTRSPLAQRWGGWWVTGKISDDTHMGNRIYGQKDGGVVATSLSKESVDWSPYLSQSSDVLALMVLEHQCEFHNQLAKCRKDVNEAIARDKAWKELMGEKEENPVLKRILEDRALQLLRVILFKNEAELPEDGVQGSSEFESKFLDRAIRTQAGRSLRDLQLNDRLFKHRCSYMIYTDSFKKLPETFLREITRQLESALLGEHSQFDYLSKRERERITEILLETAPFLKFSKLKVK